MCALASGAAASLLLLALVALDAAADTEKRAESEFMSPMPFVLGSRYGRSQPRLIAPRNDRFFMGSRYGKRSDPLHAPPTSAPAQPRALLCDYTGVYSLYRCSPPKHNNFDFNNRRAEDDRELGEED